jgi:hypothetical protein
MLKIRRYPLLLAFGALLVTTLPMAAQSGELTGPGSGDVRDIEGDYDFEMEGEIHEAADKPDCTTSYMKCLGEARQLPEPFKTLADIECAAAYTGCVIKKVKVW